MSIKRGQLITLEFEGREFEVIVIDPNGLGKGQPSVGFGFRMMERHGGLPEQTTSNWSTKESGFEVDPNNEVKSLKVPSGKLFRLTQIIGSDSKPYSVLEISEWVALAADVIKHRGKVRKSTADSLVDFLSWFAVKGFYADAYAILKGAYTEADSRAVSAWMRSRLEGISRRNRYTAFLQRQGCEEWYEYANWTNYVYKGLFGMDKREMTQEWELVEGSKAIGRNYIPEPVGLDAVAYCEDMVEKLFVSDLQQAHDDSIGYARRKFFGDS
jgi:hypothetical protein